MLKEMKTHFHLKPGQNGTKRLVEKYGDSLLHVRYRYDESRRVGLKAVEIVVEEKPWQPPFREKLRKLRGNMEPSGEGVAGAVWKDSGYGVGGEDSYTGNRQGFL